MSRIKGYTGPNAAIRAFILHRHTDSAHGPVIFQLFDDSYVAAGAQIPGNDPARPGEFNRMLYGREGTRDWQWAYFGKAKPKEVSFLRTRYWEKSGTATAVQWRNDWLDKVWVRGDTGWKRVIGAPTTSDESQAYAARLAVEQFGLTEVTAETAYEMAGIDLSVMSFSGKDDGEDEDEDEDEDVADDYYDS